LIWESLLSTKPSIRPSIGTENPISEETDHREIAGRVPVMNEVQFLFASESPVLVSSAPPGQTTFCFRYKMKDGAERWSRTPVGLDGRPPDLSATIGESGRSSAYACKLAAAQ